MLFYYTSNDFKSPRIFKRVLKIIYLLLRNKYIAATFSNFIVKNKTFIIFACRKLNENSPNFIVFRKSLLNLLFFFFFVQTLDEK